MENLLNKLEQLYSVQGNAYVGKESDRQYFKSSDTLDEVEELCNELLITESGSCNWDNINILRNHGYRVFAGEKDSFGWLTGCIQKIGDQRILVYG